jgi:hypothetical protein
MVLQDLPFILKPIQEIPNFKSWVNGYYGLDVFIGHTEMHLFWFFVDDVGWWVMHYKVSPINVFWSLKDGSAI